MLSRPILILEDEFLIALDIDQMLSAAGYTNTQVFSSCEDAAHWLEDETPCLAIVDIMLRDGNCEAVAGVLHERSVPLIVCSGEAAANHSGSVFSAAKWLNKPAVEELLLEAVRAYLGQSAGAATSKTA